MNRPHDEGSAETFFRLPAELDAACAEGWREFVADPPRSRALALGVFESCPDARSSAWAGLCLAYHLTRSAELEAAADALRRARGHFDDLDDVRGTALASVFDAYLDMARGQIERAVGTLEPIVADYATAARSAPLDHFLACHTLALAHGRQGHVERVLQYHYANLLLLEQCGSPSPLAVVLLNLSSTLDAIDDWEESLGLALRAVHCCERLNNAALERRAQINVALALRFLGRLDEALALLEKLRAQRFRDPGSDFALYINSAEALAHGGNLDEARRWLDQARLCARPAGDAHERANLAWIDGLIAARAGDLAGAIERLEGAKRQVIALRKLHVPLLPRIVEVLASCYARSGDHARAFETFQQFHASYEARLGYTTRARYTGRQSRQGVAAIGASAPAQHLRMNEALRRTLVATRDEESEGLPGWSPRSIARAGDEARGLGVEAHDVGALVEGLHRAPDPSGLQGTAQAVRVLLLGGFEIRIAGKRLAFGRKRPERPLALLKYLAAQGMREVPEVEVADALWPDLEGDAALRALAVNVHRLRQLLGGSDTVTRHERRLAIDARRVWCDAAMFEWLLDLAAATRGNDERDRLMRAAIALYRGDLPVDEDRESWALAARRRLRARFVGACAGQGARFAAAARWDEARASFSEGLAKDEIAEELCLGLMRSCLALDRPDEAIAAYRRLERALASQRAARPSAAIDALYGELLARLR